MIFIDEKKCIGCGACVKDCFPQNLILEGGIAVAKVNTCLRCGHCVAVCPENAVSMMDYPMEEVQEYNKSNFYIDPDNLLNFIRFRRSIRQYDDKPVEDEKIERILEAGRFTATAGNRQDVSYVIVQKELAHYKKYIWDSFLALVQKTMEKESEDKEISQHYAPLLANICEHYQREPKRKDKLFFQAPAMILVLADTPIDGALASSTMELMANAQGLGVLFSGFIVKAIQNSQEIKRKLKITDTKQCISCMLIGYPKVTYRRTVPRKVVEALWI